MVDASRLALVLGPTNTGKTHRAIERMLEHESGLLGVPLRLLAREIYDRLLPRVGPERLALVTGEERIVPRRADYVIATVEAMPLGRDYDFIAVDEIQLAGHHERGHVFTNRLLHARGRKETWFLGSQTMLGIGKRLVPTAEVQSYPRLSTLSFAGSAKLSHVPKRSAVVAFSLPEVYATAERLRGIHGGAAVVSGALSPRTRNAQVAMYQRGEVDFLVATDAIGMGLNLDVRHVAFMGLRKFDGRAPRALDAAEVAQIAGRAGRALHDGSFGVVAPQTAPEDLIFAVESHQFAPLTRIWWRNADLDFSSPAALLDALALPPPRVEFRHATGALDADALQRLLADAEVKRAVNNAERLHLLWDVCAVPDYRKLLIESHVALLKWLFLKLVRAPLSDELVEAELGPLRSTLGEVDMLTARIARTRTWSFVAERPDWLAHPERYRQRARELEDSLSDALHARLVLRFVDATKQHRTLAAARVRVASRGQADSERVAPNGPFAALERMRSQLPQLPNEPQAMLGSVHDASSSISRAEAVIACADAALMLDPLGRVCWSGQAVARLARGRAVAEPGLRLELVNLPAPLKKQLEQRVRAWITMQLGELVAALTAVSTATNSAAVRGLVLVLTEKLGSMPVPPGGLVLAPADLDECGMHGIRIGRWSIDHPRLTNSAARGVRWIFVRAFCDLGAAEQPTRGYYSADDPVAPALAYMGYCAFGDYSVRGDLAERWLGEVHTADSAIARALRCPPAIARTLLEEASERLHAAGEQVVASLPRGTVD
jgi:ATP-dependent RNA helicase SUPV3L1/SUV3